MLNVCCVFSVAAMMNTGAIVGGSIAGGLIGLAVIATIVAVLVLVFKLKTKTESEYCCEYNYVLSVGGTDFSMPSKYTSQYHSLTTYKS